MEVECLGACINAPMMQINDDYYEDLDKEKALKILDQIILGKKPEPGSYRGRLNSEPENIRSLGYDIVMNGYELGGGSIRIHDRELQKLMFKHLGFSDEEAQEQFGFLMNAFEFGAPPHGGIALGFDRLTALFGGHDSIRDFIAFPKNNAGRDIMIDSPSEIANEQLDELNLKVEIKE